MFIVPVTRDARQLSRLLDERFERFFVPAGAAPRSPALDLADTGHAFVATLEIPGVAKEDVKVSVEGRRVDVQARSDRAEQGKEGDRVVYRERAASHYARSFTLPVEVEQSAVAATLDHGVLTLTLPKRGPSGATQVTIN